MPPDLRDAVIDWLFCNFPCLLADDVFAEGLIYFVGRIAQQAVLEERRRRYRCMREPKTFNMN